MIRILLQVVILEYFISAVERDLPNQSLTVATPSNSTKVNMTSQLKVDKTEDHLQNLLDICLLITEDIPSFLKKVEKCTRNFPKASENKTFTLNFCNSMLGENDSNANILIENSVLGPTFENQFAEHSWNEPTNIATVDAPEAEYITLEKPLLELIDIPKPSSTKLASVESNLELKMEEEWAENDPKASYKSHIYIGTSKFPLSFKTSRVINTKENVFSFLEGVRKPENSLSKSTAETTVA